jgi:hypothetical protein
MYGTKSGRCGHSKDSRSYGGCMSGGDFTKTAIKRGDSCKKRNLYFLVLKVVLGFSANINKNRDKINIDYGWRFSFMGQGH